MYSKDITAEQKHGALTAISIIKEKRKCEVSEQHQALNVVRMAAADELPYNPRDARHLRLAAPVERRERFGVVESV